MRLSHVGWVFLVVKCILLELPTDSLKPAIPVIKEWVMKYRLSWFGGEEVRYFNDIEELFWVQDQLFEAGIATQTQVL